MSGLHIGIIGGSGLAGALEVHQGQEQRVDTPFGPPSSSVVCCRWQGVPVAMIQRHGPGHIHHPSRVPYRANIYALKKLGVTHIVASGATGTLQEQIKPGDLVIVDQTIDKTYQRPNTFFDHAAVHVEMAEPFCPVMRRWLIAAGGRLTGVTIHTSGTYVCMEGPAFSTRAESLMHRAWGGDLVGMTACPEAKLAREAEMAYALVAMPTDYDCWRLHDPNRPQQELIDEIVGNLKTATQRSMKLIQAALTDVSLLNEPSDAHTALRRAIWTDKAAIDAVQIRRLDVLWGRYFT